MIKGNEIMVVNKKVRKYKRFSLKKCFDWLSRGRKILGRDRQHIERKI